MSLEAQDGKPVHFPANPEKFEFDAEVSAIFPNMARRSIPTYEMGHQLHAAIAASKMREGSSILDIGASHGEFFSFLKHDFQQRGADLPNIRMVATDNSPDMCKWIAANHSDAEVLQQDLMENPFLQWQDKFDFINCMYVLQFIPVFAQRLVLTKICTMLKPGGILSIGHKELLEGTIGEVLHDEYIGFRLRNGYTMEEIVAKTAALRNSMWPMRKQDLTEIISRMPCMGGLEEVTRWGVFATYVVQRKE